MRRRDCLMLAALAVGPGVVNAADERFKPWPRQKALPALRLPSLEGAQWALADQRGKPVLLNFWASWCEPCRSEMPALELLATRHEAQSLQVVAINYRETDAAVRRFVDSTDLSLTVLRDRDGAAAQSVGVRAFPASIGIHRNGQALWAVTGEIDWNTAEARRQVAALFT